MVKQQTKALGWIVIGVALFSAVSVYFREGLSYGFLFLLIINILAAIIFRKTFSRNAISVSRTLVGMLFIFSGFVKGVDPMGTIFKMEEYMSAYGTEWAMPIVPFVAILMIALEFSLGCFAVLNIKPKMTAIGLCFMMAGFSILTFLDAITNPVSDCGCFGDFIKMSNWQTFYKNLVIDALLLMVVLNYNRLRTKQSNIRQISTGGLLVALFFGMEIYAYFHKPIIDFLPWKEGSIVVPENRLPVQYYYTCENKLTGETKEYLYEDLIPYLSDSAWNTEWKLGARRDVDPNPQSHNLRIVDEYGQDLTESILQDTETPTLIVTIYNIENYHKKALPDLEQLYQETLEHNYNFVMFLAATPEEIQNFITENNIPYSAYMVDDTELKMINRSNPGLMLLQNNKVQKKWDYNNIPTLELLQKIEIK